MVQLKTIEDVIEFSAVVNDSALRESQTFVEDDSDQIANSLSDQKDRSFLVKAREVNSEINRESGFLLTEDTGFRAAFLQEQTTKEEMWLEKGLKLPLEKLEKARKIFQDYYEKVRNHFDDILGFLKDEDGKAKEKRGESNEEGLIEYLKKGLSSFNSFINNLGIRTDFLSVDGAISRMGEAAQTLQKDRKTFYKSMSMGLGFGTDEIMDYDQKTIGQMNEYLDSIRELRIKYPSLSGEFDNVILSLRRSLPATSQRDLFLLLEDARRLSMYTGESFSSSAKIIADTSRLYDRGIPQVVEDLAAINALGQTFVEVSGVNVDLEKFRENTLSLARLGVTLNLSLKEAGDLVFRFARSLDRGTLGIQDIITLLSGYTKGSPGKMAFVGDTIIRQMEGKDEFKQLVELLKSQSNDPISLSRLVETISTRSQRGYAEFGIEGLYGESEAIAKTLNKALMLSIELEVSRFGQTKAQRAYWMEELLMRLGMIEKGKTVQERRALVSGQDVDVDRSSRDLGRKSTMKYKGKLSEWRGSIDQNTKLIEDVTGVVNQMVDTLLQEVTDWKRWVPGVLGAMGISPSGESVSVGSILTGVLPAPIAGPLSNLVQSIGVDVAAPITPSSSAAPGSGVGAQIIEAIPSLRKGYEFFLNVIPEDWKDDGLRDASDKAAGMN